MTGTVGTDTLLVTVFTDAAAVARLAQLHPAFAPDEARALGVPEEATLGDMARATGLPLPVVLAAARGEIAVPELCGCHGKDGGCGSGH